MLLSRLRHRQGYGIHSPFAYKALGDILHPRRGYTYYKLDTLRKIIRQCLLYNKVERSLALDTFRYVARYSPAYYVVSHTLPVQTQEMFVTAVKYADTHIRSLNSNDKSAPYGTLFILHGSESQRVAEILRQGKWAVTALCMDTKEIETLRHLPKSGVLFYSRQYIFYMPYQDMAYVSYDIEF